MDLFWRDVADLLWVRGADLLGRKGKDLLGEDGANLPGIGRVDLLRGEGGSFIDGRDEL